MVGKVCHYCEPNLLAFFFCVLLVGFSYLLIFLLGLQNFWDLLDFCYGLVC